MTDITTKAQKLLDGATPGPWELINGEIHQIQHTPEQCTSIRCDHRWPVLSESWGESAAVVAEDDDLALMAAVPEMAQALAEETWEYAVQVKCTSSKEWRLLSFKLPFITHKTTWFRSQSEAEHQRQEQVSEQVNSRIVRRRVSPLEVISE